ncbi:ATP-binding protein [Cylindrospermopsis raciborskii]|uniref:ATP-binding protein n=1 Tax=Cylindrospermopsis raciborskii TaxID=77022 RepID=UPI001454E42B|nr:tetratricopeptide repeat protein [Cylindrospermopsis raciborskii]NLQ04741.1 tetratricopeptide repeat protein [Cylindrospermopsis raciborskii MVCC19]
METADNIESLIRKAQDLLDNKKTQAAIDTIHKVLEFNPNSIEGIKVYGQCLVKLNQIEDALAIFKKGLEIAPNNVSLMRNYGITLYQAKEIKRAVNVLDSASKIEPNNIKVLNSYARVLSDSGNYEKAREIFERSLQIHPNNTIALTSYGKALADSGNYEKASEIFERSLQIQPDNYIYFTYGKCLEELGRYENAISQLKLITVDKLPQYHKNVVHISLGRVYYFLKLYIEGDKHFNIAIANSDDREKSILSSARSILAHSPHNQTAVKMLQQIAEESPRYAQAMEMLTLNLTEEEYFKTVPDDSNNLKDAQILNRAIYHKIANEITILKSIAYRILRVSSIKDALLESIISNIEEILQEINHRRSLEKSQIEQIEIIANNEYGKILEIIAKTAHDISDFVNNELAIVESKTRRAIKKFTGNDPQFSQFNKLLTQLELTQDALNDLKAINEGIRIKNRQFKVKKIFETWEFNTQIDNAQISLNIENGDSDFNGDEEKIKSILNELVENSLKHNPDNSDLQIKINSQDVTNPPGIRGANIPGSKKYLYIEFIDNGLGIAPDKKDWVFQPLNTTATGTYSSGLGLFIIRKTLTQMGGYIREVGVNGVKFEIYIPYPDQNI